jgi:hypothetical protein
MNLYKPHFPVLAVLALFFVLVSCSTSLPSNPSLAEMTWQDELDRDLHLLGHRNWILVVDKAFPEQSSQGMKYLYVEEDLVPALKQVLEKIGSSTHVSPLIYTDKELAYITEEQVPGIGEFREKRAKVLAGRPVNTLLHNDVFELLDESSSLFRVLVIKTSCTLPYTSVFLQLDCAYWSSEDEQILRQRMSDSAE